MELDVLDEHIEKLMESSAAFMKKVARIHQLKDKKIQIIERWGWTKVTIYYDTEFRIESDKLQEEWEDWLGALPKVKGHRWLIGYSHPTEYTIFVYFEDKQDALKFKLMWK